MDLHWLVCFGRSFDLHLQFPFLIRLFSLPILLPTFFQVSLDIFIHFYLFSFLNLQWVESLLYNGFRFY